MVHIVGAGIAGLLLAEQLESWGVAWHLWEKAPDVGQEASGKNAGIIRSYEADPVMAQLARASLQYYHSQEPSFVRCGIALAPWEFDYTAPEYPKVKLRSGKEGVLLENDGCVEPMAVLKRLATKHYRHGSISFSTPVVLESAPNSVRWRLGDTVLSADDSVVLACGEGAITFDKALQRGLALIPHLRTLYEYENSHDYRGPVEWDEESGCYFRASGRLLIATVGEQVPVAPRVETQTESDEKTADEKALRVLAAKFPFFAQENLRGSRTCRRLMPLDNRPYCGRDPAMANLYWLTGLGGRGMSIAPALSAILARLIVWGQSDPLLTVLSPGRVQDAG